MAVTNRSRYLYDNAFKYYALGDFNVIKWLKYEKAATRRLYLVYKVVYRRNTSIKFLYDLINTVSFYSLRMVQNIVNHKKLEGAFALDHLTNKAWYVFHSYSFKRQNLNLVKFNFHYKGLFDVFFDINNNFYLRSNAFVRKFFLSNLFDKLLLKNNVTFYVNFYKIYIRFLKNYLKASKFRVSLKFFLKFNYNLFFFKNESHFLINPTFRQESLTFLQDKNNFPLIFGKNVRESKNYKRFFIRFKYRRRFFRVFFVIGYKRFRYRTHRFNNRFVKNTDILFKTYKTFSLDLLFRSLFRIFKKKLASRNFLKLARQWVLNRKRQKIISLAGEKKNKGGLRRMRNSYSFKVKAGGIREKILISVSGLVEQQISKRLRRVYICYLRKFIKRFKKLKTLNAQNTRILAPRFKSYGRKKRFRSRRALLRFQYHRRKQLRYRRKQLRYKKFRERQRKKRLRKKRARKKRFKRKRPFWLRFKLSFRRWKKKKGYLHQKKMRQISWDHCLVFVLKKHKKYFSLRKRKPVLKYRWWGLMRRFRWLSFQSVRRRSWFGSRGRFLLGRRTLWRLRRYRWWKGIIFWRIRQRRKLYKNREHFRYLRNSNQLKYFKKRKFAKVFRRYGKFHKNVLKRGKFHTNVRKYGKSAKNVLKYGKSAKNVRKYGKSAKNVLKHGKSAKNVLKYGKSAKNVLKYGKSAKNVLKHGKSAKNVFKHAKLGGNVTTHSKPHKKRRYRKYFQHSKQRRYLKGLKHNRRRELYKRKVVWHRRAAAGVSKRLRECFTVCCKGKVKRVTRVVGSKKKSFSKGLKRFNSFGRRSRKLVCWLQDLPTGALWTELGKLRVSRKARILRVLRGLRLRRLRRSGIGIRGLRGLRRVARRLRRLRRNARRRRRSRAPVISVTSALPDVVSIETNCGLLRKKKRSKTLSFVGLAQASKGVKNSGIFFKYILKRGKKEVYYKAFRYSACSLNVFFKF